MVNINNFSLYIHLPWCVKRCPYCDFNAHTAPTYILEDEYINALKQDIVFNAPLVKGKKLISIFFGGGTPSLFSADAIAKILEFTNSVFSISSSCEITLEANPGTLDNQKIKGFNQAGVNRLSIGVQSFNNNSLKLLGRIHDADHAIKAIQIAQNCDYNTINCDLMFGLEQQDKEAMLLDLNTAINLKVNHISWYELTFEPNTLFAKYPPKRVDNNTRAIWYQIGKDLLQNAGYKHYEVSAFTKDSMCLHNSNIWEFGDYLGIGAGAHSKINYRRYVKQKHPNKYMQDPCSYLENKTIDQNDLAFEYLLNRLRLFAPILWQDAYKYALITQNDNRIITAINKGFIDYNSKEFFLTPLGRMFIDDIVSLFLE